MPHFLSNMVEVALWVFIHDVTADRSSRILKWIEQMDNELQHTAKATLEFLTVKKWDFPRRSSQSPDRNPIQQALH